MSGICTRCGDYNSTQYPVATVPKEALERSKNNKDAFVYSDADLNSWRATIQEDMRRNGR